MDGAPPPAGVPPMPQGVPTQQELDTFRHQVGEFKRSADSGGFGVNDEGGRIMQRACDDIINENLALVRETQQLTDKPRLGGTYGAKASADAAQQAGIELQTRLGQLNEVMAAYREAIGIAMKNYTLMDENGVMQVRKAGPH
ncbi:hypothetical protein EV193_11184 [Herbihabitans rhizosphaerae]|uniref:Uncharacterized protein n=1 Tax=Herbihabitans rhizosphaerae TaxID=1872711 RepID=A0A4Q7KF20_9PSEU|nr:hypothetical protein [Herbihabitans rhizosphaerae]RZS32701.1 hypothetical protein EV193_11184 [Herbihabitans rhizosphaerae]